jgi:hypothetical protein
MPTFGRRNDGLAGRRRTPREEVVLAGSARSLGASRPVVVSDVSPKGAKLQGREMDTLDQVVLISVGEIDLFACVAWASKDECGVNFDEDLSPQLVSHIKREANWAKVMGMAAD